jgi:hypothetical protein
MEYAFKVVSNPDPDYLLILEEKLMKMQRVDVTIKSDATNLSYFEFSSGNYLYTNDVKDLSINSCNVDCELIIRVLNFKNSDRRLIFESFDGSLKIYDQNTDTGVEVITTTITHADLISNLDIRLSVDETYMMILTSTEVNYRSVVAATLGDVVYTKTDLAAYTAGSTGYLILNSDDTIMYAVMDSGNVIQISDWTTTTIVNTKTLSGDSYHISNHGLLVLFYT